MHVPSIVEHSKLLDSLFMKVNGKSVTPDIKIDHNQARWSRSRRDANSIVSFQALR